MTEQGTRLGVAALLLATSQLASRLLGYVREAVLAYEVGVSADVDAYRAAFQIPDLLNHFLSGGALAIAFIPLYTRYLSRGDEQGAQRLFELVFGTVTAVAVVATALLWWYAEPLVAFQFGGGFSPETQALTVRLTRIVLPAQIFFLAGGILRGALMARGSFSAQAAAPILYNLGIIAGGLLLAPRLGVAGFSWGALGGAVLGPFLVPLWQARKRLRIRMRFAPWERAFREYAWLAAPLILGATLLTVDEWYDRWFGANLGAEGTVALLGYGRFLLQAPVGIVGQAVATAALPFFSKLWAEGRREELDRLVNDTLHVAGMLSLLAGAAFFALANPVVVLLYQRGAFTGADSVAVAAILMAFTFAVPAWVIQQIAVRSFYARGEMWRPMLLGTGVAVAAIPVYLKLGASHGGVGLAVAGAIAMTANAFVTLVFLRLWHAAPSLGGVGLALLRGAAMAVPAALAASHVQRGGEGTLGALIDLALGGLVFAVVALPLAYWIGGASLRATLQRLFRREVFDAE